MATNEVFRDADHLSLPVPAGTKAGEAVRVGGLNVVTETDRANTQVKPFTDNGEKNPDYNYGGGNPDGHATCWLKGAHSIAYFFGVKNVGEPIYIKGDKELTWDNSNPLYGHALTTKAEGDGTVVIRLAN